MKKERTFRFPWVASKSSPVPSLHVRRWVVRIDDNYWNPEINLTTHRVTPDNVVELLQRYATPLDFDVLSLDWSCWYHSWRWKSCWYRIEHQHHHCFCSVRHECSLMFIVFWCIIACTPMLSCIAGGIDKRLCFFLQDCFVAANPAPRLSLYIIITYYNMFQRYQMQIDYLDLLLLLRLILGGYLWICRSSNPCMFHSLKRTPMETNGCCGCSSAGMAFVPRLRLCWTRCWHEQEIEDLPVLHVYTGYGLLLHDFFQANFIPPVYCMISRMLCLRWWWSMMRRSLMTKI